VRKFLPILLLALAVPLAAQVTGALGSDPGIPQHDLIKLSGTIQQRSGDDVRGVITATIEQGWHVNSNKPTEEFAIPTVLTVDPAAFERVLAVHVHGTWHTVRATLPDVARRGGHVLVVGSLYSFMAGPLSAPYAMAKAAIEQLGRALRTELRPHGATAGVAYFGFVETALVDRTFAQPAFATLREVLPDWYTRPIPVQRAADAIVRGVERRSARVVAPRWVAPLMAARGLLPALDERLARDERVQAVIRATER